MNFEDARAAIYGRLKTGMDANYASVPVEYQNRVLIDLAVQTAPWVSCELVWTDGEPVTIETTPMMRYRGTIYLASWVKEGAGTAVPLAHMAYLAGLFKNTAFGGVNTHGPIPMPVVEMKGWEGQPIRVPFWFDQRG